MNVDMLKQENERLRQQNARLLLALEEVRSRLAEPEDVIRAIRQGEIDALVVQEQGQEEIYSLQRFDAVYRIVVEECFPYGVWLAEPDGRLMYVTPSFLERLQTNLRDMQEKGQFHYVRPDIREAVEREWTKCRTTREPFNVQYTVRFTDGSERTIWTHGILTQTQDGLPRWVGVNIDVTEREQIKDQLHRQAEALREADRCKDNFLAMLSHELRNPLAPIQTSVDRMRLKIPRGSDLHPILDVVERQLKQMTRLVDDLMDVSRITQGRITLKKEQVDLRTVLAEAVETARPVIDACQHQLTFIPSQETLLLEADLIRLTQALSNILTNAAKYTEKGGRIWLTAERDQDQAVVRVRDNGIGIEPEMLPRVFDLFSQAHRSLDRSRGGMGVGLAVAKRLVEMHGGSMTAQSAGKDQGSEFGIRLPLAKAPSNVIPGSVRSEAGTSNGRAARRRVLIVDDLVEVAEEMAALIREAFGHEVRTAHEGPTALQAATEFRPELVLLDIGMPGMSGCEVARRLRALPDLRNVVLIAVTGWGQENDRRQTQEARFDHHLVKPVGMKQLQPLLARMK